MVSTFNDVTDIMSTWDSYIWYAEQKYSVCHMSDSAAEVSYAVTLSIWQKKVLQLQCEMEAEKERALQELEEQARLELQELKDKHKQTISEIKKKQWVCMLLTYARINTQIRMLKEWRLRSMYFWITLLWISCLFNILICRHY